MKKRAKGKKPSMDSGVEEEIVPQINVKEYLESPLDKNEVETPPKRRPYKTRKSKEANAPVLGSFLQGMAQMFTGALNGVLGEDMPLSQSEAEMIKFSGDNLEQFGDTSDFNKSVGRYGWYIVAGSFGAIALTRVIAAYKRKKYGGLLPAQIVE